MRPSLAPPHPGTGEGAGLGATCLLKGVQPFLCSLWVTPSGACRGGASPSGSHAWLRKGLSMRVRTCLRPLGTQASAVRVPRSFRGSVFSPRRSEPWAESVGSVFCGIVFAPGALPCCARAIERGQAQGAAIHTAGHPREGLGPRILSGVTQALKVLEPR